MSGTGGYYRFRCKYFLSHECPNWVYINNAVCAECSAKGRDAEPAPSQASTTGYPTQICVPHVVGGVLYYTLMEVETVQTDGVSTYWIVRYTANKPAQPQAPATTSAFPGTPTTSTSF
ncbi:hypothetical protein F5Y14DRAFT_454493 [Nemania sp. NC0429]|nr:hypothetical protein F5Y14DRAFT_454493 [Nemania sp. NC0429]